MDRSWINKKQTAQLVSSTRIDTLESVARAHGAKSAKVSGAGGGGYMIFVVDPNDKPRLARELEAAGGITEAVAFTSQGVETWAVGRPA